MCRHNIRSMEITHKKGVTICCKYCKQILIRYIHNTGKVSFDMLCPYCHKILKVSMKQVNNVTTTTLKKAIKFVKDKVV
jgi:hypothetical protein